MSDPFEDRGWTRYVAKITDPDVEVEDHGCLVFSGCFEFDYGRQGLGYIIDGKFLKGLLGVFGGRGPLSDINGKSCWIYRDAPYGDSKIVALAPLHAREGVSFDITLWSEESRTQSEAAAATVRLEREIKDLKCRLEEARESFASLTYPLARVEGMLAAYEGVKNEEAG